MSLIVDLLRECRSIDRLVPKSWRFPGLPQTAAVDPLQTFITAPADIGISCQADIRTGLLRMIILKLTPGGRAALCHPSDRRYRSLR
jgi:hypothetical protein